MNSSSHLQKFAAIAGAAAAIALSSCTLPPEQAWRKIRTEGLIAYWSYELGSQHAYAHLRHRAPGSSWSDYEIPRIQPRATPAPMRPTPLQPGMLDTGATLMALSIPALPGFVRSPYTNPPRLVDVQGAIPGTTMICPYTQRPFIVPPDYGNVPGSAIAGTSSPNQFDLRNSPPAPRTKVEPLPSVVINKQPVAPAPRTMPEPPRNRPAPSVATAPRTPAPPATSVTPSPAPLPAPKPVQEIPFGSAIAGRPGFVNSPFAAKHQLVDVTGLPAGMEVKCPYTGKLFRVPPQDLVSTKPAEIAPLASPEEPKKK
jgi:hypothetical protein